MDSLIQDLRYGVRALRKSAGASTVALLTLAAGIGANTAIFSLVDGVLLKPLPYPYADRIVAIWEKRPTGEPNSMSTLNYLDYADQNTVFEHMAAVTGCCSAPKLTDGPVPVPVLYALHVSPSYFDIFGAKAALGRTFTAGDDQPGHDHVVVLSHRLWVSQFGSDPALIGRTVHFDGEPHTVVGVMPQDSPFDRTLSPMWLPLSFGPERMNRNSHWLLSATGGALARLKPGVTLDRARAEMDVIAARLSTEYPNTNHGWGAVVEPYTSVIVGRDLQQSLYLLFAAVGLVLLIGCVNLANVMLARGLAREREIAVRLALGAGRARLIQQFLTESVLLSIVGGLLGIAVGYVMLTIVKTALLELPLNPAMPPNLIPPEAVIGLDPRVLIFTLTVSIICGLVFGLAPAIAATRTTRSESMALGRRATATAGHRRFLAALIVTEVALAFVLLTGAGLLIRSFFNMRQADTGFESTNVLTAQLLFNEHRFANAEQLHAFIRQVIAGVGALPGVRDVAFTDGRPLQGAPNGAFFHVVGRALVDRAQRSVADFKVVTPSYFRALGLRVRRGRALRDDDRDGAPLAAVINETMARKYFGSQEAVGQYLLMERRPFGSNQSSPDVPWEIVGVIADERLTPFDDKREHPAIYVANEQYPTKTGGLVIRASSDPSLMQEALRQTIATIDKDQAVIFVKTLEQLKSESMIADRLRSSLLGLFAAIALLLSAIGIYGVVSYSVVQRTHEIGIRAALGANARDLVQLIMGRGVAWTALGLAFGSVAALALSRLLNAFLFGVGSSDGITWITAAGILGIVAAIACYIPARHVTRIDPLEALRAE